MDFVPDRAIHIPCITYFVIYKIYSTRHIVRNRPSRAEKRHAKDFESKFGIAKKNIPAFIREVVRSGTMVSDATTTRGWRKAIGYLGSIGTPAPDTTVPKRCKAQRAQAAGAQDEEMLV